MRKTQSQNLKRTKNIERWFDLKIIENLAFCIGNRPNRSHSHTGNNESADGTKDELNERMQNAKRETK